jgi:signal transduction histidine kinase
MSPAGRLLYSWRTDGGPWSAFAPLATASFPGLARGQHYLEVRAMDRAGNVDPTPAAFSFTVLMPWYLAPGFLVVGLASLGTTAALIVMVASRHLRLERLVEDRTSALAGANVQLREQIERERVIEDERARLETQLNQSQKLEAIGRRAGGVAHDFNNLLSVIGSYSELMLDELPPDAELRTPAAEIAKASDRAAALTRQLLAFSRHQVVDAHPLDLNDVVADVQRMLRRLIGENIDLVVDPAAGLWRVLADRGQIEQVLFNLAANARDAMPGGGTLTIRTANVDLDAEFVRVNVGAAKAARQARRGRHRRGDGRRHRVPRLRALLHDQERRRRESGRARPRRHRQARRRVHPRRERPGRGVVQHLRTELQAGRRRRVRW